MTQQIFRLYDLKRVDTSHIDQDISTILAQRWKIDKLEIGSNVLAVVFCKSED